jgi:hypothetical protein
VAKRSPGALQKLVDRQAHVTLLDEPSLEHNHNIIHLAKRMGSISRKMKNERVNARSFFIFRIKVLFSQRSADHR